MAKAKVTWTKQLGGAGDDFSWGVAADSSSNVYITGGTKGDLAGSNAGGYDAWIAKYDGQGNQQWVKQLGTSGDDKSWGIAVDSSGNICITGDTTGSLGGSNAGGSDAWVAKYDGQGNQLWIQQLGTAGDDNSYGVATDGSGNIYIAGGTTGSLGGSNAGSYDAWVAKYDGQGKQLWVKQLGTSEEDKSWGIAASDSGNVYITGRTKGALEGGNAGSFDAWVAKYDSEGNQQWIKQLGSSGADYSYGVAVDSSGNVYITGRTTGSLGGSNAGGFDAWVAKYDSEGNQQWVKQLGTSANEFAFAVAVDGSSNVYISGCTQGGLAGSSNAGGWDAWVAKYDSDGNQQWLEQLGTSSDEFSWGVAVDGSGNIYATGHSKGELAGSNAGGFDAWVAKLSEV
ncbi:MAG: SBBP repeat-containing protein [Hormoscilla sp.]